MRKEIIKTAIVAVIGLAFALSAVALIGEKAVGATWAEFALTKIGAMVVFLACIAGFLELTLHGLLPRWMQRMLDEEG